ncbi:hypothetical protein [Leptolyngbya sp. FACHB-261]|uniref:hypothetical protein n=1 Tax=Leptolyngbya sp. FACHB-261 TaxID=2692806 RepID=UPI0016895723|nr:hypothetical protein [Leptolyngbya sp. FACHB-261]MBD2103010.1 hypothetical protein [Leptolyngbya sp. FACHB-261]
MKRLSLLLNLVVIGITTVAVGGLQAARLSQTLRTTDENPQQAVEQEKIRLAALHKVPSMGFDNLIADWAFLGFLQYFGDEQARQATGYELSGDYFDIIIGRDPQFLLAYLFVSTSTSMYAAQPARSVAILSHGLESLSPEATPEAYLVWRYKAIDQLLFLGDRQGGAASFAQAANWAERFAHDPTAAAVSRQTAQFLQGGRDLRAAQMSAWTMVLTQAVDERTAAIARQQILDLGGQIKQKPDGSWGVSLPPRPQ